MTLTGINFSFIKIDQRFLAGRDCMLLFGGLSSRKEQNSEIALSDIWIFDQNLVTSTIASDPAQRVLQFPKLWKQCGADFSHKSWRDCPEVCSDY